MLSFRTFLIILGFIMALFLVGMRASVKKDKISLKEVIDNIKKDQDKFLEKKDFVIMGALIVGFLLMFYGVSRIVEGNNFLLEACYVICEIILVAMCVYPLYVIGRKIKRKEMREKNLIEYSMMNVRNWYFMPPIKRENRYDVIIKKSHNPVQSEIWYAIDKRYYIEKTVGEGAEGHSEIEEILEDRFFSELKYTITSARATNSDDYQRMLMNAQEYLSDGKIVTHLEW